MQTASQAARTPSSMGRALRAGPASTSRRRARRAATSPWRCKQMSPGREPPPFALWLPRRAVAAAHWAAAPWMTLQTAPRPACRPSASGSRRRSGAGAVTLQSPPVRPRPRYGLQRRHLPHPPFPLGHRAPHPAALFFFSSAPLQPPPPRRWWWLLCRLCCLWRRRPVHRREVRFLATPASRPWRPCRRRRRWWALRAQSLRLELLALPPRVARRCWPLRLTRPTLPELCSGGGRRNH